MLLLRRGQDGDDQAPETDLPPRLAATFWLQTTALRETDTDGIIICLPVRGGKQSVNRTQPCQPCLIAARRPRPASW